MKLRAWLKAHNMTMEMFADRVGVAHSTVSRLCTGKLFPSRELALAIRKETNGEVTPDDFLEPCEAA